MACIKSSLGRDFLKYCWQLNVLAVVDAFGCCLFLALVNPSIQVLKNGELPPEVHQEGTGGRENCSSLLTPPMAAHGVAEPCDSLVFDLVIRVCNAPPSLSLSLFFPPHTCGPQATRRPSSDNTRGSPSKLDQTWNPMRSRGKNSKSAALLPFTRLFSCYFMDISLRGHSNALLAFR